jgi:hypothetical protein
MLVLYRIIDVMKLEGRNSVYPVKKHSIPVEDYLQSKYLVV